MNSFLKSSWQRNSVNLDSNDEERDTIPPLTPASGEDIPLSAAEKRLIRQISVSTTVCSDAIYRNNLDEYDDEAFPSERHYRSQKSHVVPRPTLEELREMESGNQLGDKV